VSGQYPRCGRTRAGAEALCEPRREALRSAALPKSCRRLPCLPRRSTIPYISRPTQFCIRPLGKDYAGCFVQQVKRNRGHTWRIKIALKQAADSTYLRIIYSVSSKCPWHLPPTFDKRVQLAVAGGALVLISAGYGLSKLDSWRRSKREQEEVDNAREEWRTWSESRKQSDLTADANADEEGGTEETSRQESA